MESVSSPFYFFFQPPPTKYFLVEYIIKCRYCRVLCTIAISLKVENKRTRFRRFMNPLKKTFFCHGKCVMLLASYPSAKNFLGHLTSSVYITCSHEVFLPFIFLIWAIPCLQNVSVFVLVVSST